MKVSPYLLFAFSLSLISCQTSPLSGSVTTPPTSTHQHLANQSQSTPEQAHSTGQVLLKLSAQQARMLNKQRFATQAADFGDASITQLKLEVRGNGINDPEALSETQNWTPGNPVNFSLDIPLGKNRVVILTGLDATGQEVTRLMGALDVKQGNNSAHVSYFETMVAQVVLELIKGHQSQLLQSLDLTALRNRMAEMSGYDPISHIYSIYNPLSFDPQALAAYLSNNNGNLPPVGTHGLQGLGQLDLTLPVIGAQIILSDPLSESILSSDSTTPSLTGIAPGAWKLVVRAPGYEVFSQEIIVTAGTSSLAPTLTPLAQTGSLKVTLNQTGVRLSLNDPGSTLVASTSELETQLDAIGTGTWTLTASKAGYVTKTQSVTITADQTTDVELTLQEAAAGGDLTVPPAKTLSNTLTKVAGGYLGIGESIADFGIGRDSTSLLQLDKNGNLLLFSHGKLLRWDPVQDKLSLLAGGGDAFADGPETAQEKAVLMFTLGTDAQGNIYARGRRSDLVRIDPETNTMTPITGGAGPGTSSDDGVDALQSKGTHITSVLVDEDGAIYFSDANEHRVRKIDPTTNLITTVAGTLNVAGNTGDGEAATQALLNRPDGLAFDSHHNLYIVDASNNKIRKIDAETGIITTVVGSETGGPFGPGIGYNGPATVYLQGVGQQLSIDANDQMYFASGGYFFKVNLSTGNMEHIAGNGDLNSTESGDGGPALDAAFIIRSFTGNANGDLVFFDDRQGYKLRRIDGQTGVISTLTSGYTGDGGDAQAAFFSDLGQIVKDSQGHVYLTDSGRVRKIDAQTQLISTIAGTGGVTSVLGQTPGLPLNTNIGGISLSMDPEDRVCMRASGLDAIYCMTGENAWEKIPGTEEVSNYKRGPFIIQSDGTIVYANEGLTYSSGQLYRIAPGGSPELIAGDGNGGETGDEGAALDAKINRIHSITTDKHGNIFFYTSTGAPGKIRKVDTNGVITTVVGGGTTLPQSAIGQDAKQIQMTGYCYQIAVDDADHLYFGSYSGLYKVGSDGLIQSVLNPVNSIRSHNIAVYLDSEGSLYALDQGAYTIHKLAAQP